MRLLRREGKTTMHVTTGEVARRYALLYANANSDRMRLTDAELAWLDRRAERIAREREWSLANARPAAMAELIRLLRHPRADVVDLDSRRVRTYAS